MLRSIECPDASDFGYRSGWPDRNCVAGIERRGHDLVALYEEQAGPIFRPHRDGCPLRPRRAPAGQGPDTAGYTPPVSRSLWTRKQASSHLESIRCFGAQVHPEARAFLPSRIPLRACVREVAVLEALWQFLACRTRPFLLIRLFQLGTICCGSLIIVHRRRSRALRMRRAGVG